MTVAVVVDSTAYLPPGLAAASGITVVPVQVVIAGQAFDETDDPQAHRVEAALRDWQPVTTSRPSPEAFAMAYEACITAGATEIVCATLSSVMSATYESALIAAKDATIDVRVVDSRSVAMGLGFAALSGARMAAQGAGADTVADAIESRARRTSIFFYVDTLEYLRRGGRIGAARALVGQALQVKPILSLVDGAVTPLERVRTSSKALARLEELTVRAASGTCDVAVQQLGAVERADQLTARLAARLPDTAIVQSPVGAVVGAHVGPGMVAAIVSPRA